MISGSFWEQQKTSLNQKSSLNQTSFSLFLHFGKVKFLLKSKNFLKLNFLKSKIYCTTFREKTTFKSPSQDFNKKTLVAVYWSSPSVITFFLFQNFPISLLNHKSSCRFTFQLQFYQVLYGCSASWILSLSKLRASSEKRAPPHKGR